MDSDAIDNLIDVLFRPVFIRSSQLLFDRNDPIVIILTLEI